jgi:hypothetical protein
MVSLLADVNNFDFGDFILWTLWIFAFIIFFWLLITVFSDLFSRHDVSGWVKAFWTIFVIFLPFLGILIYLISQGHGMAERAQKRADQQVEAARQTLGYSGADELAKIEDLKRSGAINDQEYQQMRARVLS